MIFNLLSYASEIENLYDRDYFFSENWKKEVISIRKEQFSYSYAIGPFNKTWFHKLPLTFQHDVFKSIDHLSLINFSKAFNDYIPIVVQPEYWRKIPFIIDNNVFTLGEFKLLIDYLQNNLKHIHIDLANNDTKAVGIEIIKYLGKLTQLHYLKMRFDGSDGIIDAICVNCKNLTTLDVRYRNLQSDHIAKITNSLPKLKSFIARSSRNIDDGLVYLISRISLCRGFGVLINRIQKRLIQLLSQRHNKSLLNLRLISNTLEPCGSNYFLDDVVSFNNLKFLTFYHLIPRTDFCEIIDKLDHLEILKIFFDYPDFDKTKPKHKIISRPKLKLKILEIKNVHLDDCNFTNLLRCCPKLEQYFSYNANLSDDCILNGLRESNNLKYLEFGQSQRLEGVSSYEFLKHIPHEIGTKLESIRVRVLWNDKIKNKVETILDEINKYKKIETTIDD